MRCEVIGVCQSRLPQRPRSCSQQICSGGSSPFRFSCFGLHLGQLTQAAPKQGQRIHFWSSRHTYLRADGLSKIMACIYLVTSLFLSEAVIQK